MTISKQAIAADRVSDLGASPTQNSRSIDAFLHNRTRWNKAALICTLVISDALTIGLALLAAWYIRIGSGWLEYGSPSSLLSYLWATGFAIAIITAIFAASGLYNYKNLVVGSHEYAAILRACSHGVLGLVIVSFFERSELLSRGWLILSWTLLVLFVGASRFFWRRIFRWLRRTHGWFNSRALIIGTDAHARAIAHQLTTQYGGYELVGFLDDFLPVGTVIADGKKVLGDPSQLKDIAVSHSVRDVILLPSAVAWETRQEVMQQAIYSTGFDLHVSPGYFEILTTSVEITHAAFVPLLRVRRLRIVGLYSALKTMLDLSLAALAIVIAFPLMALVALALWFSIGRPVLERHTVLGLGALPFQTTRFRTGLFGTSHRRLGSLVPLNMTSDGKSACKMGRFLYRTGLDKLPQLFDVLRGRMSIVGPRPIPPAQEISYGVWVPNLLTVKPGLIGPWAVSGAGTRDEEVLFDTLYVRNWTIWYDLRIILRAAELLITGRSRTKQ